MFYYYFTQIAHIVLLFPFLSLTRKCWLKACLEYYCIIFYLMTVSPFLPMNSLSFGSYKKLLDFIPRIDTPHPSPPPLIKITGPQIRMCSFNQVVKVPATGFPDLSEMPLFLGDQSFMYLYFLKTYEAIQLRHVNE